MVHSPGGVARLLNGLLTVSRLRILNALLTPFLRTGRYFRGMNGLNESHQYPIPARRIAGTPSEQRTPMDFLIVAITLAFFLVGGLYVAACDRL